MAARDALSADEVRAMLLHMADAMVAAKDELTLADQAIGDGDHGLGIARGFTAVREKLQGAADVTSISDLFKLTGRTLLMTTGGAAGPIFGGLFTGGAATTTAATQFDSAALADFLGGGLSAIQQRGNAQVGDKTLVDALDPAAKRAKEMREQPLPDALYAATQAAAAGLESTRGLQARFGKAKSLGERAVGHPDPGAISLTRMLQSMYAWITR